MEIRQLRYFVAIADTGSFSEASRRCFLSQSAISQQIKLLEEEFKTVLFNRTSHSVSLTESGEQLLPMARRILEDINKCQDKMDDLDHTLQGTLNIGLTYSLEPYIRRTALLFIKLHQHVQLNLKFASIPDLIRKLRSGEIDMAGYSELGMFADLNEFIDGENGIDRSEYFDNVFRTFSRSGKQYELPLFFRINEIVGRQSDVGDISSITFEELERMSEEKRLFSGNAEELVNDLIEKNLTEFVNIENFTCDFDNEDFIRLLKIIKREASEDSGYYNDFIYGISCNPKYISEIFEVTILSPSDTLTADHP